MIHEFFFEAAEPAGGVFLPASIPDLVLGLDPSFGRFVERAGAAATTPAAVGGPVGTWTARTGQHFVADADGNRPLLQTDGLAPDDTTNDKLVTASGITLTGDFTVYCVGRAVSGSTWPALSDSAGASAVLRYTDNTLYIVLSSGLNHTLPAFTPAGRFVVRARRTGSSISVAGTGAPEVTSGSADSSNFIIDAAVWRPGFGNDIATNRYGTMLVYSRYLDPDELAAVEAWLAQVEGVSL